MIAYIPYYDTYDLYPVYTSPIARTYFYDSDWNYVEIIERAAWVDILPIRELYPPLLSLRPRQKPSGYG